MEPHAIAGLELTDFPQLGIGNHRRAHEAAQARSVRAENHRHVAGEIDGADGVRVVVDVRRMQACFAAIRPRPLRLGSDQAHAGAARVVMHFPSRREKHVDVLRRKKIGRAVRTVQHANVPLASQSRQQRRRQCVVRLGTERLRADVQHVAGAQGSPRVTAEATERESRFAAEVIGHIEAARHRDVCAQSRAVDMAQLQHRAGLHGVRAPLRDRAAVDSRLHVGTADGDHRVAMEFERRARRGAFERSCALRIAEQPIGQAQRQCIHRPRRRHADVPKSQPAGPILNARLHARLDHFDSARTEFEGTQIARGGAPAREDGAGRDLPQVFEVRFDAAQPRIGERPMQLAEHIEPVRSLHDQLGDHRIVERRHFGAAFNPGLDARIRRKRNLGEQPAAGLKLAPGSSA